MHAKASALFDFLDTSHKQRNHFCREVKSLHEQANAHEVKHKVVLFTIEGLPADDVSDAHASHHVQGHEEDLRELVGLRITATDQLEDKLGAHGGVRDLGGKECIKCNVSGYSLVKRHELGVHAKAMMYEHSTIEQILKVHDGQVADEVRHGKSDDFALVFGREVTTG